MSNNNKDGKIKMIKFILIFSILYMIVGHTNYMNKVFNTKQSINIESYQAF